MAAPSNSTADFVSPASTDPYLVDADLLFNAQFVRSDNDLLLFDGPTVGHVVPGYFSDTGGGWLFSEAGASLSPSTVNALSGQTNSEFAQATGGGSLTQIGKVNILSGSATVTRTDGSSESLSVGAPVYQGDVVQTAGGSKMTILLADGTAMTMSASARMVLNELIYNPNATDNSMALDLVQGTFVFVTGQVAKTGNMSVDTPVATMGIRGTAPVVKIDAVSGATQYGIVADPDGTYGRYVLINKVTGEIIGTVSSPTVSLFLASVDGTPQTVPIEPGGLLDDRGLLQDTYDTFGTSFQIDGERGNRNDPINRQPDPLNPDGEDPDREGRTDGDEDREFVESLTGPSDGKTLPTEAAQGNQQPDQQTGTTIDFTGGRVVVEEDGSATFSGFNIVSNDVLTAVVVAGSTVTLASTSGLTFLQGDGTNDSTLVFSGTADAINAALNGATYFPTADSNSGSLDVQIRQGDTPLATISIPVTINPVADDPVAISLDFVLDAGINSLTSGFLGAFDPDPGDTFTASIVDPQGSSVIINNGNSFTINAGDGFTQLPAGQTLTRSFTYQLTDSTGRVSKVETINVTFAGQNEPATITGTTAGAVTEDVAIVPNVGGPAFLQTAGQMTVNDPDTGEAAFAASSIGTQNGTFGTFTLNANGSWTYQANNDNPAIQALKSGETATDTFTVQSVDGTKQQIVITITGAADGSSIGGEITMSVTEDVNVTVEETLETGGQLTISQSETGPTGLAPGSIGTIPGTYGTFSVDASGQWNYKVNNNDPDVQSLGKNDQLIDSIIVQTLDGNSLQTISVVIDGTNDPANITGNLAVNINEDGVQDSSGNLIANGKIDVADVDTGEAALDASSVGTFTGTFGQVTIDAAGNWNYTADNSQAAIQNLNTGQSVTDNFTVTAVDGTQSVLSITINGVNEPVVGLNNLGFEDANFNGWNSVGAATIQADTTYNGTFVTANEGTYFAVLNTDGAPQGTLESTLGLSPGAITTQLGSAFTEGSAVFRTITVNPNDVLSFDGFFDSLGPPSDNDQVYLIINDQLINIEGSGSIGSVGGGTGWASYAHTFEIGGTYDIGVLVVDGGDNTNTSQFYIDNFKVTPASTGGGGIIGLPGGGLVGGGTVIVPGGSVINPTNFDLETDSINIDALIAGGIPTGQENDFVQISLSDEVGTSGTFNNLDVFVDSDGPGTAESPTQVATLGLTQPTSSAILSVIFDSAGSSVDIATV
ncbi:MAG: VCBS domain-containing protein [Pseudomonadota bacterium]